MATNGRHFSIPLDEENLAPPHLTDKIDLRRKVKYIDL